jgi:hypothetical protein
MTPDELPADMEARTPAPEGEAWRTVPVEPTEAMLVNGREALMPLVRLDSYGPLIGVWEDMLAASPVVPAPEGEAVDRVMAVLNYWFDGSRRIDRNSEMVAQLAALASPVVPVGSGEVERKLVGQDYINAIKAHRVEHGSSLAVARNAVDCGWRPPAPVVPVGVSEEQRQRVAEIVEAAIERHAPANSIRHMLDDVDAIIAALRPTDTGANHD